jgi:hypothetical protein
MSGHESRFGTANQAAGRVGRPRGGGNASGYLGVSWSKAAHKWAAYIRRDGMRHYLGLFETAYSAHVAYLEAAERLHVHAPDPRPILLDAVRALYETHGIGALSTPFLTKSGFSPGRLRGVGLMHADLLRELGLSDEYARHRATEFKYAGKTKPRWNWDIAIATATALKDREGDLPSVQWCRLNGYSPLTNVVHRSGLTWEDLREAIGLPPSDKFYNSRVGIRWRSRPEASLSNFLYARGVEHRRGERYAPGYSEQSGRAYARYDLHFKSVSGEWIDVEVWGDIPDAYSHGRYRKTRAFKEAWHAGAANFLGLQYQDCLSDARLTELLEPYIGDIAPFQYERPQDRMIETAHWSDADDFLETCRELALKMPDGMFPGDEWLRKRGRYADRPGPEYNTISQRVNSWMKGTRNVRQLLGQTDASTIKWTRESVITAWHAFKDRHGLTPSQLKSRTRRDAFPASVVKEAQRIYAAADRLGALDDARNGVSAKVRWTPERAIAEWREFHRAYGLSPSQVMGSGHRKTLPRGVSTMGARIYSAALKLGVLAEARSGV